MKPECGRLVVKHVWANRLFAPRLSLFGLHVAVVKPVALMPAYLCHSETPPSLSLSLSLSFSLEIALEEDVEGTHETDRMYVSKKDEKRIKVTS